MIEPYYEDKYRAIYHADCRDVLPQIQGVTAVVTDPPYELKFMGKKWDGTGISFQPETWALVRASCLLGAPLLSFGGTRTFHRIACALEDAGWELRDTICWVFGSGFPKALDISKAVDKVLGAERTVVGILDPRGVYDGRERHSGAVNTNWRKAEGRDDVRDNSKQVVSAPATLEAKLWNGWKSALKPAYEPILLCMNPLDGSYAENALKHGVAGLNIDECRVPVDSADANKRRATGENGGADSMFGVGNSKRPATLTSARYPSNFIHDDSEEVVSLFPRGAVTGHRREPDKFDYASPLPGSGRTNKKATEYTDSGSAARYFYCAKSSRSEREWGLDDLPERLYARSGGAQGAESRGEDEYLQSHIGLNRISKVKNTHPTVKPLALMEYLCKLVKMPERNLVLDPFVGSGTTLLACAHLGIQSIGIDSDESSCEIAAARCAADAVRMLEEGTY